MSTSVTTTRTGLISDLGRTPLVVAFQHQCLRIATRLSRRRDSVGCITATLSRPNNFQLQTNLRQDRREIHAWILADKLFPLVSGMLRAVRRPRHTKRCCPRKGLQHRNSAAFSLDEPQGLLVRVREIQPKLVTAQFFHAGSEVT